MNSQAKYFYVYPIKIVTINESCESCQLKYLVRFVVSINFTGLLFGTVEIAKSCFQIWKMMQDGNGYKKQVIQLDLIIQTFLFTIKDQLYFCGFSELYFLNRPQLLNCVLTTFKNGSYILWKIEKYFPQCLPVVFACGKLWKTSISFVDLLLSAPSQSPFHCVLAFGKWIFILLETMM